MESSLDPYPRPDALNYYQKLCCLFDDAVTEVNKIPKDTRDKFADQRVLCVLNYYKSIVKRDGQSDVEAEFAQMEHKFKEEQVKNMQKGVKAPALNIPKKISIVEGKLIVEIKDTKHSQQIRSLAPIKSELILATLLGLHSKTNKQAENLLKRDSILMLLGERKNIFGAFSAENKRAKYHDRDHENETLENFEEQRTDFERLCSNHTVAQYEQHCNNMRSLIRATNPELNAKLKFKITSSKHTEVQFHNDKSEWTSGFNSSSVFKPWHGKGRFHMAKSTRPLLQAKLNRLGCSQQMFNMSQEDRRKILKRKAEETAERKSGKKQYIAHAIN